MKTIKGWVLVNDYGDKEFIYYNGVELCVHSVNDWEGELELLLDTLDTIKLSSLVLELKDE